MPIRFSGAAWIPFKSVFSNCADFKVSFPEILSV